MLRMSFILRCLVSIYTWMICVKITKCIHQLRLISSINWIVFLLIFSPCFHYVVILLVLCSYFRGLCAVVWFHHRQKCLFRFVITRLHVSLTYRPSMNGSHSQVCFKAGLWTKKFEKPCLKQHSLSLRFPSSFV